MAGLLLCCNTGGKCCELTHANPSDSAWLLLPYDESIVGENDYFTNLMLRTLL